MKTYQQKQIDKFMSARKRELTKTNRNFPKFREGMLVGEYIREFQRLNSSVYDTVTGKLTFACQNYFEPASMLKGPEVIVEEC